MIKIFLRTYGLTLLLSCIFSFLLLSAFTQSNRLTNEKGQLLWQYSQIATPDEENQKKIRVSFIFINGVNQMAFSLRQELFHSQVEWIDTSNLRVEREEHVEFVTVNLSPNQYAVINYVLMTHNNTKELVLEKSALLIMNEDYEIKKESIPEQKFEKK